MTVANSKNPEVLKWQREAGEARRRATQLQDRVAYLEQALDAQTKTSGKALRHNTRLMKVIMLLLSGTGDE